MGIGSLKEFNFGLRSSNSLLTGYIKNLESRYTIIHMKKVLLFSLLSIVSLKMFGQQDPIFSQYLFNPMVYNPAYAGVYNMTSASLQSRIQAYSGGLFSFTNFFSATTSVPGADKMGLGINFVNDRIGVNEGNAAYNRNEVDLAYSYKLQLGEVTYLSAGLQVDFFNNKLDNDALNLKYQNDPFFTPGSTGKTQMNFGTGLYLLNEEKFFLGVSIPKILNTQIQNSVADIQRYNRTYYISGGAIFNREGSIPIRPSFLIRTMQGAQASIDLSTSVLLSDIIWAGVSVRNGKTVAIIGQLDVSKHVRIGYSTDIPVSGFVFKNLGTHEISVNINFAAFKNQVVVYPRYF